MGGRDPPGQERAPQTAGGHRALPACEGPMRLILFLSIQLAAGCAARTAILQDQTRAQVPDCQNVRVEPNGRGWWAYCDDGAGGSAKYACMAEDYQTTCERYYSHEERARATAEYDTARRRYDHLLSIEQASVESGCPRNAIRVIQSSRGGTYRLSTCGGHWLCQVIGDEAFCRPAPAAPAEASY